MIIQVSAGKGLGPTKMAAFDAALQAAGTANYNLIRLSSIIPAGSKVVESEGPISKLDGQWGDRLYVVMAETRVNTHNMEAWAGIGWVQDEESGRGLFVEHEGANKASVVRDITQSLEALTSSRGMSFGPINMKVTGATCDQEPVCALVIAVFQASDWKNMAGTKGSGLS